ncbi:methyltransferase domain-containing protein [Leptospira sp. id769339]|uniref:methyltransferase domain-containing protein n=1 Tax=Leptospira sp. id769339 TaxID=2864221 RepID=UPI00214BE38B|nr:methyltransferase [Leptospira sp. id769339]
MLGNQNAAGLRGGAKEQIRSTVKDSKSVKLQGNNLTEVVSEFLNNPLSVSDREYIQKVKDSIEKNLIPPVVERKINESVSSLSVKDSEIVLKLIRNYISDNLLSYNETEKAKPKEENLSKIKRSVLATKFRNLADSLENTIQAKESPAIANMRPTRRRAGIANSMYEDAKRLKKTQTALLGMASVLELNQLPPILETVKSRKDVESILSYYNYMQGLSKPLKLEVRFPKLYHYEVYQGDNEPKIRSSGSVYNISMEWAKDNKIISPELFKQAKKFIRPTGEDPDIEIRTDSAKEADSIKKVLETAKQINGCLYVRPATPKTKNRVKIEGKDYEVYFKGKTYLFYSEKALNLLKLGFNSASEVEKAGKFLTDLINQGGNNPANEKKSKIKKLERDLIGRNIPGFFPTPQSLGENLLEQADIEPGMSVLEPSAGKGDLADQIQEKTGLEPDTIEMNSSLREILTEKNHKLVGWDFLEFKDKTYDRIIMNPPFENGQDMEHVRHAYDLLNPGGRLVAIVSEGPFYRSDSKARSFRDWISEKGGISEQLPENSFSGKDSFRQTSIRTRLVVLDKPLNPNALSEAMKGNKNAQGTHLVKNANPENELITKDPRTLVSEEVQATKEEITKQKVSEINLLKSALPAGTKVTINEEGQEGIISDSKLIDGELYYKLTNGKTVSSGIIKIPSLVDPLEIDSKIHSATAENRAQVRKSIIGTAKTEDEATEEIEKEKVEFSPGSVNHTVLKNDSLESRIIPDYSKAPVEKIIFFNEKTILEREKPAYIPSVNFRDFEYFKYSFPKIKVDNDTFLVQLAVAKRKYENGKFVGNGEPEFVLMNADSLVATENYYRTLIKAQLKKKYESAGLKKRIILKEHSSNRMSLEQYELISNQLFGADVSKYDKEKNKKIWDYYRDLRETLGYKTIDVKRRTADRIEQSTYYKGRDTSYGDSGLVKDLYDDFGVLVKRQNGSNITPIEINQVRAALSDLFEIYGNRSEMARKFGLKISHSGNVLMHARNWAGLFYPQYKAIGISFKGEPEFGGLTLSHEFAHFMDFYIGRQKNLTYASEKLGSIENDIASVFRQGVRTGRDSEYYSRSTECFARAFEMYFYEKKYKDEDFDQKENPSWEYFRTKVHPLIDQFFEVNQDYLKSEIFGIVFSKKRNRELIKVA